MEQIELHVTKRETLGKKVRFLRRQGVTPVHLFGHNIESMALQCDTAQLQRTTSKAGRTKLINLMIGKARKPRSVLIREVQMDAVKGKLLHVDFYEVSMMEKISVEVPIILVGEAPAQRSKSNMLVHEMSRLNIEVLPGEIPSNIELDISSLSEADQAIRVSDIKIGAGITILDDLERVVVKVATRYVEKAEEEVAKEEVTTPGAAPSTAPSTKE